MIINIKGEDWYSIKELEKLLGYSFVGVLCLLRSSRIRCCKYKNKDYVSIKDFEKLLEKR